MGRHGGGAPALDCVRPPAHRRGRQPRPGLATGLLIVACVYVVLTVATVVVLRRLAASGAEEAVAPQEELP
ncbi:hypothetical protein Pflav_081330 [Phytohabitans flavus]|uniref:Uncharacterized protein n=1 Tax=Phytohabitans flavus TaxID=1076124 RepID=A0A6F8Y6S7_9ACTN|nr:hypothetical protein Pflav_081330 [Phytohabitans flavus]